MSAPFAVTATGQVLDVERKRGEFDGRSYDFQVVHLLVGTKVQEVRLNPDNGDVSLPAIGEVVSYEVTVPKDVRPIIKRHARAAAPAAVKSA